jgi:hypothetical protein
MHTKKTIAAALAGALAAAVVSAPALAQSSGAARPQYEIGGTKPPEDGPRGVQAGEGLYVFPYVKLGLGRDDNLFQTNGNETSSSISLVNPGALVEARRPSSLYRFAWDSKFANYHSSTADNYQDHNFNLSGDYSLSSSAGLRLGYNHERGHDARGSTDRALSSSPDRFRNNTIGALFAYGANQARGRIEIEGSLAEKHYVNNRSVTQFGDRDTGYFRSTAYFRVMPRTSVLVEYSNADFDYVSDQSFQDSKEQRYMAGVTWEATAATSGTAKFGRLKKEFDTAGRADFSGSNWEVAVDWRPRTYSKFDFYTVKSIAEATGIGDFILTKRTGVAWTHNWNSRLSSTALYNFTQDDFKGGGAVRKDETDQFGFKVDYKVRRWLTLGADYTYTDRDSNLSLFRYKRNMVMFTLGATL